MENAIYGGRVDNTFDMRVLNSYLEQCFDDRTITGQAVSPARTGRKNAGLAFGNIPVSVRLQVRVCTHTHTHRLTYTHTHTHTDRTTMLSSHHSQNETIPLSLDFLPTSIAPASVPSVVR